MFDESRTRALVFTATSLRPFFVAFVGLCLVQMLSGCILGSERPDLAPDIPPKYGAGNGESAPPALDWWRGFRSLELTNLIEEAQAANLDIAAAIGRIMQADAQAKIIGAPLLPEVDFAGFAQRVRPPGGPERNVFQAALNASYEIDFWGKNRAASRAAQQTAVATRFDKEVVVLSTIAAVGNSYFLVLDGAGPAADRAAELRGRQPRAHADQAAVRCRHRLAARRRATAEPGRPGAREPSRCSTRTCARTSPFWPCSSGGRRSRSW